METVDLQILTKTDIKVSRLLKVILIKMEINGNGINFAQDSEFFRFIWVLYKLIWNVDQGFVITWREMVLIKLWCTYFVTKLTIILIK